MELDLPNWPDTHGGKRMSCKTYMRFIQVETHEVFIQSIDS